jgi:hypothetical protein
MEKDRDFDCTSSEWIGDKKRRYTLYGHYLFRIRNEISKQNYTEAIASDK